MGTSDEDHKHIEQLIHGLHKDGKLPVKVIPAGSVAFRVQETGYKGAAYFGCPKKPQELGRYNDPGELFQVWYGAEHPSGALAETFGRLRPPDMKGLGIVLSTTDLEMRDMCTVEVVRDLKLLDLKPCFSKLHRTVDEVTGPEYTLTQAIVSFVARLTPESFDGIAYESRHHPDGRSCYALWVAPDGSPTVSTVEMTKLSEFEHYGETPDYFDGDVMDAEEILTEILGYRVTAP
jgi:hypothetical protein